MQGKSNIEKSSPGTASVFVKSIDRLLSLTESREKQSFGSQHEKKRDFPEGPATMKPYLRPALYLSQGLIYLRPIIRVALS